MKKNLMAVILLVIMAALTISFICFAADDDVVVDLSGGMSFRGMTATQGTAESST